jgi:hypothetical protein
MAGATFTEVVDWLIDHAGEPVYVEVGMIDPAGQQLDNAIVVTMHPTLGEVENATDIDRERNAVVVRLVGGERDRIYIDPARVTRVEGGGGVLKVWIHDASYIAFSGRVGPRGGVGYRRPSAG